VELFLLSSEGPVSRVNHSLTLDAFHLTHIP
jgi:hypothetical protein